MNKGWIAPTEGDIQQDDDQFRTDSTRVKHLKTMHFHIDTAMQKIETGRLASEIEADIALIASEWETVEGTISASDKERLVATDTKTPLLTHKNTFNSMHHYTSKRSLLKHEEVRALLSTAAQTINTLALRANSFTLLEVALRTLSLNGWVGEKGIKGRFHLRPTTLRNMACFQKREGNLKLALKYLEKARQTEILLNQGRVSPETLLAIGSLLTQIGQPVDGAECSKQAVRCLRAQRGRVLSDKMRDTEGKGEGGEDWLSFLLASACYNLGVAQTAIGVESEKEGCQNAARSFSNARKHAASLPTGKQFDSLKSALASVSSLPPLKNTANNSRGTIAKYGATHTDDKTQSQNQLSVQNQDQHPGQSQSQSQNQTRSGPQKKRSVKRSPLSARLPRLHKIPPGAMCYEQGGLLLKKVPPKPVEA